MPIAMWSPSRLAGGLTITTGQPEQDIRHHQMFNIDSASRHAHGDGEVRPELDVETVGSDVAHEGRVATSQGR
jgi:hypothetical protein